ncbi:hypothetical protein [Streptomyces tailanensis]|uniref:hypothetical protein n=1 Tax=Streptomyces tailanensis TaxID=2569858 RepID=UPI00122EA4D5|nr:hypothetical protein [Streptomyces tailanensis]
MLAQQLTLELDVTRLWLAFTYPGAHKRLAGDLPVDQHRQVPWHQIGRPRLSAINTLWVVLKRGPDDLLVAEAERVLQHPLVEDDTISSLNSAIAVLVYADRLESAAAWCGRLQTAATERHASTWNALFTSTRALIALRRGSLRCAAEAAEGALRSMSVEAWGVEIGLPLATAIEARAAMRDHAASAELVNSPVPPGLFETRFGLHYLYARGRHYLATGYYDAALADLIECGEKAQEWDLDSPTLAPWRTGAVEVWLQRGQRERASRLADEHLALVKRGRRRTLGGGAAGPGHDAALVPAGGPAGHGGRHAADRRGPLRAGPDPGSSCAARTSSRARPRRPGCWSGKRGGWPARAVPRGCAPR